MGPLRAVDKAGRGGDHYIWNVKGGWGSAGDLCSGQQRIAFAVHKGVSHLLDLLTECYIWAQHQGPWDDVPVPAQQQQQTCGASEGL